MRLIRRLNSLKSQFSLSATGNLLTIFYLLPVLRFAFSYLMLEDCWQTTIFRRLTSISSWSQRCCCLTDFQRIPIRRASQRDSRIVQEISVAVLSEYDINGNLWKLQLHMAASARTVQEPCRFILQVGCEWSRFIRSAHVVGRSTRAVCNTLRLQMMITRPMPLSVQVVGGMYHGWRHSVVSFYSL